jgi:hypothetical protein
MVSIMPLFASLLSLLALLSACGQAAGDHDFHIENVDIRPGYQKISTRYSQQLSLSRKAVLALQKGVPLTIQLDMELRDSMTLTLLADDSRYYEIRYMPLSQRYQLTGPGQSAVRTFPRLRHVMNEFDKLSLEFKTGPLAPGKYEFRARTRLNKTRLPAPMQLPAFFSAGWQQDTEWSTWPFEINA